MFSNIKSIIIKFIKGSINWAAFSTLHCEMHNGAWKLLLEYFYNMRWATSVCMQTFCNVSGI